MSLGWQSESTLLPKKAKPIQVGGSSMEGLKALVSSKQHEQLSTTSHVKVTDRSRSINSKRTISSIQSDSRGKTKNLPTKKKTKSVTDEEAERSMVALTAKAKLYEKIAKGEKNLVSGLIDFAGKKSTENKGKPDTCSSVGERGSSSEAVRVPSSTSSSIVLPEEPTPGLSDQQLTYQQYEVINPRLKEETPQWEWSTQYHSINEENSLCGTSSNAHTVQAAGARIDHGAVGDDEDAYLAKVEAEKQMRQAIQEEIELEQQTHRRNASSNEGSSAAAPTAVDRLFSKGGGGATVASADTATSFTSNSLEHTVSQAARVKTQWDKVLNSSARGFIEQIHQETLSMRSQPPPPPPPPPTLPPLPLNPPLQPHAPLQPPQLPVPVLPLALALEEGQRRQEQAAASIPDPTIGSTTTTNAGITTTTTATTSTSTRIPSHIPPPPRPPAFRRPQGPAST